MKYLTLINLEEKLNINTYSKLLVNHNHETIEVLKQDEVFGRVQDTLLQGEPKENLEILDYDQLDNIDKVYSIIMYYDYFEQDYIYDAIPICEHFYRENKALRYNQLIELIYHYQNIVNSIFSILEYEDVQLSNADEVEDVMHLIDKYKNEMNEIKGEFPNEY